MLANLGYAAMCLGLLIALVGMVFLWDRVEYLDAKTELINRIIKGLLKHMAINKDKFKDEIIRG